MNSALQRHTRQGRTDVVGVAQWPSVQRHAGNHVA